MKRKSASELARLVREERLELTPALIRHLRENVGRVPDVELVLLAQFAIGYANMGQPETMLELDGEPRTAAEILSTLDLTAFLEGGASADEA